MTYALRYNVDPAEEERGSPASGDRRDVSATTTCWSGGGDQGDDGETVNRVAVGAVSVGLIIGSAQSADAVNLTASLSVSERYTTNLFLTTEAYGAFATFVSPGGVLAYQNRHLDTAVTYLGTWEYYVSNPRENRNSHSLIWDGRLHSFSRALSGLGVLVSVGAIRTAGLPAFAFDDAVLDTGEGVRVSRLDTIRMRSRVAVDYTWSRRSSVALSYATILTRYARIDPESIEAETGIPVGEVIQPQDSITQDFDVIGRYVWRARTTWSIVLSRVVTRVDPPENTTGGPVESSSNRVAPGFEYRISSSLNVAAHAGIMVFDDGVTDTTGDLTLAWEKGGDRASVDYTRETGTGGGLASGLTVSDRARLRMARRWGVGSSIFSHFAYAQTVPAPVPGAETRQLVSYEFRLGYEAMVLRWMTTSITYQYFQQESDDITAESASVKEHLLHLTVTVGSPTWRTMRNF